MLWKKFKEFIYNLNKLGLGVQQGVLYEGVLTDDSIAEFKRLLGILNITPCCVSEYSDSDVFRGDIESEKKTIYVMISKQRLNKVGFYNVKIEFIIIEWYS